MCEEHEGQSASVVFASVPSDVVLGYSIPVAPATVYATNQLAQRFLERFSHLCICICLWIFDFLDSGTNEVLKKLLVGA